MFAKKKELITGMQRKIDAREASGTLVQDEYTTNEPEKNVQDRSEEFVTKMQREIAAISPAQLQVNFIVFFVCLFVFIFIYTY